ncbi:YesL family protein [Hominifimenecus sp. rT4P-3]|uniref:YesL family protein n=1 Tax=Hominifimenecus sp. rT4P-3 TaxID=3242979 RepID=UPI003DA2CE23
MNIWSKEERETPERTLPAKTCIGRFAGVFQRNFFRLIGLNLIYLLACLPVITIPAAMTAMTQITIAMEQRSYFFWSDFWDVFREEFGRAFASGFMLLGGAVFLAGGLLFYWKLSQNQIFMLIPFGICAAGLFLLTGMRAYVCLMLAVFDLPLKAILKNAFLLVFLRFPQTLTVVLIQGMGAGICYLFFPLTIPLVLLFHSSFQSLIGVFLLWPGIKQYVKGEDQESAPDDTDWKSADK